MFKSGFFKSVITLLSGSATAQIIMVLSYFIIARWFGPDFIGEIRVFASITLTGALLVNGGYELAVMLPSKPENSLQLLRLCLRILLVSLAVMAPIGLFFSHEIADLLKSPALGFWAKVLPFSIFMEGAINLLHQFLVRSKKYKNLSFALLSYSIIYALIAIPGVYTSANINWLDRKSVV